MKEVQRGHTCHATGCSIRCNPEYLMCGSHWRRVPRRTKVLVWRHYAYGQCNLEPMPTQKWHAAADLAIAEVASEEGLISQETLERVTSRALSVLRDK